MKTLFPGHYRPAPTELEKAWKEAIIVLDTNVLLNLYRYNAQDRSTLLTILEKAKDRIWIPHHVALEYQHGRLGVIESRLSSYHSFLSMTEDALGKLEKGHVDRRLNDPHIHEFIAEVGKQRDKLRDKLDSTRSVEEGELRGEGLRNRIESLFEDKIGPPPMDQKWLDNIFRDGAARKAAEVPPGYMDRKKKEKISWSGLRFDQAYGDLVIWEQLRNKASEDRLEYLLFITDDEKEDWWWTVGGKKQGPRPELVTELLTKAPVKCFWMQTTLQFLEQAKTQFDIDVPSQTIQNVREVLGPTTSVAIETVAVGWDRQDFAIDEPVDQNSEFYFHAHTTRIDQVFAVYYLVVSKIGKLWVGFTNRVDGYYRTPREYTDYIGQSGSTSYEFNDSVLSTIEERFPELKGQALRLRGISCRGDAAGKDSTKFYVGLRR